MNSYYGLTHDKVSAYLKATGWQRYECQNPRAENWGTTMINGDTLHLVLVTDSSDPYYADCIRETMVLIGEMNKQRDQMWADLENRIDMVAYLSRN